MQAKRLLTIAGVIFLNMVLVAIVLEAVGMGENPISRASVAVEEYDFGDAPADRYPTLQTDDGARHIPDERWLGSPPDLEADGQSHPAALGDDHDGNDDEDGVLFLSPLVPGTTASVSVTASFTGWLNAWLDFHSNDQWADPEDQIFADEELRPGQNRLTFSVPEDAISGPTFSRWRFSSETGLSYETGFDSPAPDGEVEDHWVEIGELPAVDSWEKWINGQLWLPDVTFTVETSDTIQVVDVIRTDPATPFLLTENWEPEHLGLLDWAIEPQIPAQPEVGDGVLTWDLPPDHPEVLVLTKWFHVEPCTWEGTELVEMLGGLEVQDPLRPVAIVKRQPILGIDALYEPEVFAGAGAQFTLVYSNTGGFESTARIRNGFPDEAPYSDSFPLPDRLDPNGLWAEWDLGSLAQDDRGIIDVVVDIAPGLQPSSTVVITDAIYNHAGELGGEVTIHYHITEPRGWLEGHVMDSETGDLLPPCTPAAVGILPGPIVMNVDPTTGYYGPAELVAGTYDATATATGYSLESTTVDILHEVTTTQNFNLWRPVIVVTSTDFVSVTAYISQPVTYQLAIGNHGHLQTDWEILEEAQAVDLPWVWEDPISGTIPPLSEVLVDVTFHCTEAGDHPGTLIVIHDDPCQGPVELPILLHCRAPKWEKWIDGQPWEPDMSYTVETSDTVSVVDIITSSLDSVFTLTERWNPAELVLRDWAVDPPLPTDPVIDDASFIWKVPPGHPEVITVTKWFRIEPCTWEHTTLREELRGIAVPDSVRPVIFEKVPPDLRIDSSYDAQVSAGTVATFTLVYSNAGGYENDVAIRNEFPPEALFLDSDPKPAWLAPDGSQVRWEIGNLGKGDGGSIDVTVAIKSGLVAPNTIHITDYIYNHAGQDVDQTTIVYQVDEIPPQLDDHDIYIKDNPLDDGSVSSTPPWWVGPDIWIRTDGNCSQTAHQNPIAGAANTICVRVRNRMATAVSNISVDLYWGSAALGLIWPGSYNIAGSAHIGSLAGGDEAVVAVPWNTPNITGHFCLLARADAPADPVGSGFDTVAPQDHVPNNNNISMRNVNIVDYPEGECGLVTTSTDTDVVYLDVVNPTNHVATVDVVFDSPGFPLDGGEIVVEPGALWGRWSNLTSFDQVGHTLLPTDFPASMDGIHMDPFETASITLTLTAEIDVRFILQVSELVDDEPVGGIDYVRVLPFCIYMPAIERNYSSPVPAWVLSPKGVFARDE